MANKINNIMPQLPVIILSKPSLSENIGSCARAMLNFQLHKLRIVAPRKNWCNDRAYALAAGANIVLEQATVYEDITQALADLNFVYAATARPRDMIKEVVVPKSAAVEIKQHCQQSHSVGILFGSEKNGLDNKDIALVNKIITIPLNLQFSSLNLAQSVIVIAYELFQVLHTEKLANPLWHKENILASKQEIQGLLDHLENELDKKNYFCLTNKKTIMLRNLINFFAKSNATNQEIQTLRGVIKHLSKENILK